MKDKWLDDLHDRMQDFEMDVPDGLWDDIEKAEILRKIDTTKPWIVWSRRIASVAAAVALAVIGVDDALTPPSAFDARGPVGERGMSIFRESPAAPATTLSVRPVNDFANNIARADLPENTDIVREPEVKGGDNSNTELKPSVSAQMPIAAADTAGEDRLGFVVSIEDQLRDNRLSHKLASARSTGGARFSAGVYSSGGFVSNSSGGPSGRPSGGGVQSSGVMWDYTPSLGVFADNQPREAHTEFKHHQPIRVGMSVAYRLTDRISLGTGLTYTNLKSDFKSDSHYFSGEQELHYVGVPLNVACDIVSWQRLTLYGTAGVLAEKCVYGKTAKDYVLGYSYDEENTAELKKKPFQWSVNASAGAQLNISDHLGVYAEPGLSYYFGDGTEVETIYKEKPLNFNLNLGVRVTIK